MSNTWQTTFKKLKQPHLKEVFKALERGFEATGIDFYLVGALARDIWMTGMHDVPQVRRTRDIDFAVLVSAQEEFEQLKDYLAEKEGFKTYKENPYVLIGPKGVEVDLMPFGDIEKEGTVTFTGPGMASIKVDGFSEIYATGLPEVEMDEEFRFKVCTLPGIVLLKLIAWDDRPEIRQRDAQDIAYIFQHYFNIADQEIYENHHDLFDEDTDLPVIAARVMGRQMAPFLQSSSSLKKRIVGILERNTQTLTQSPLADQMALRNKDFVGDAFALLKAVLAGIQETIDQ